LRYVICQAHCGRRHQRGEDRPRQDLARLHGQPQGVPGGAVTTGYRLDDTTAATLYLTAQAQTLTPNVRFALDNFLNGLAKTTARYCLPRQDDMAAATARVEDEDRPASQI
jgi:hypothetical protein